MGTYALVKDGEVVNLIVWDGPEAAPMEFPDGITYAEVPDGEGNVAAIGWLYDGKEFSPAPLPEEDQAEVEAAARANNIATQKNLIETATLKITVWQTKLLIGRKLADSEIKQLNAWLDYIDSVNAIDADTPAKIDWPQGL